ncbi:hypothetical protein ILUMI_15528 [Ignelater luminosus]|uniref:Uncharacterized protein n=1 Tax=Ignelater luminosus TaxID=2038154 RepID=A0A8K0CNH0_IGNLU|nr:hypothetical protein ILUMI_15528 [Ignelater luminosus]
MNDLVKQYLEVETKIKTVRKLGSRTCLIEMNNTHEKNKIMQSKSKLKDIQGAKIYINDDVTRREREGQTSIRKFAYEERSKGKDLKIAMKKVVVNSTEWKWNKEEERLIETMTKNQQIILGMEIR